jgi:hypothetical protein
MRKVTFAVLLLLGISSCSKDETLVVSDAPANPTLTDCTGTTGVAKVVCAAQNFKATLSTAQLAAVQLDYTQANAVKWSNLPCGNQCRNGVALSTLSATQLVAAKALIAAVAGTAANDGYDEAFQIVAADDVLGTTAGSMYSAGLYYIAFLGTPTATGTWQLQFGGHHLALNTTYKNGAVAGATPIFEGVEPKTWTTNGTTYAPLANEQATMAAMLASLSTAQLATARLATTFSDVVLGPNQDGKFPATKLGLPVSSLSAAQQALVLAAMRPWVQDADDATAASLLATYQGELANTYIAYSGNATLAANADYVRIDGPSAWIEFVCQSGVVYRNEIHYHSVWRDRARDYGASFTF